MNTVPPCGQPCRPWSGSAGSKSIYHWPVIGRGTALTVTSTNSITTGLTNLVADRLRRAPDPNSPGYDLPGPTRRSGPGVRASLERSHRTDAPSPARVLPVTGQAPARAQARQRALGLLGLNARLVQGIDLLRAPCRVPPLRLAQRGDPVAAPEHKIHVLQRLRRPYGLRRCARFLLETSRYARSTAGGWSSQSCSPLTGPSLATAYSLFADPADSPGLLTDHYGLIESLGSVDILPDGKK